MPLSSGELFGDPFAIEQFATTREPGVLDLALCGERVVAMRGEHQGRSGALMHPVSLEQGWLGWRVLEGREEFDVPAHCLRWSQ